MGTPSLGSPCAPLGIFLLTQERHWAAEGREANGQPGKRDSFSPHLTVSMNLEREQQTSGWVRQGPTPTHVPIIHFVLCILSVYGIDRHCSRNQEYNSDQNQKTPCSHEAYIHSSDSRVFYLRLVKVRHLALKRLYWESGRTHMHT